jgi:hypothetical protein
MLDTSWWAHEKAGLMPKGITNPVHPKLYALPHKGSCRMLIGGIDNLAEIEFDSDTVQQEATDRPESIIVPAAASAAITSFFVSKYPLDCTQRVESKRC